MSVESANRNRDPLSPSVQLLVKLGSALVHAEEFMEAGGHEFDKIAFDQLMCDQHVREWMNSMTKAAMLPVKRQA